MKKMSCIGLIIFVFLPLSIFGKTELKMEILNSAPKYIQTSNKSIEGLCIELAKLIEENSDYEFSYPKNFTPLKRITKHLSIGETNIHFGLSKNTEREKLFIYGEPLYQLDTVAVSRSNDNLILSKVEDLQSLNHNKEILGLFGSGTNRYLRENLDLNVDENGKTIDSNLSKIMAKRGRVFIYHNLGLVYKMQENKFKDKLKIQPLVIKSSNHWVVFSKETPVNVREDINKTIRELKENGEWQEVTNKYLSK